MTNEGSAVHGNVPPLRARSTTGTGSTFLGPLATADRELILARSRLREAGPGSSLLLPHEDALLILLRGSAVARSATPAGALAVSAILRPGATWGLAPALRHEDNAAELSALVDSAGLLITGRDIRELIDEHPTIARAALEELAAEATTLRSETARLAALSATGRVLLRLAELCETWGEVRDGEIHVMLPLTQDDLGGWARASRESVARVLQELRRGQVIRTARRRLTVLDPPTLAARLRRSGATTNLLEFRTSDEPAPAC